MAYTEIKERNGRKYYYRVISIRNKDKIGKKREYLGVDLDKKELFKREEKAGRKFLEIKINKNIQRIKSKILPVLNRYKIRMAGVFGSYVRGEQTKGSDVDIIVEPPKEMGFAFVGIAFDLEKALRKKVDLLTYKGINPLLRKYILEEEVRII